VFHAQLDAVKISNHNEGERVRLALTNISERKQLETVTKHCERYQLAESGSVTAIWDWDIVTGQIRYAERWYQLLGYWSHNNRNTFAYWESLLHPEDRDETLKRLRQHLEKRTPFVTEYRLRMGNGQYRWLHASGQAVWDEQGQPVRMTGTVHDITECKQQETELRIATALESQDGIIVTDAKGLILRVNQTFTDITGYSNDEVIGKNPNILHSGRQSPEFYTAMWKSLNDTGTWEGEIWNRCKNGEIYPEYLSITAVKDQNGKVNNYVAVFTNNCKNSSA
jgi:PAS domain S-box-containing protein